KRLNATVMRRRHTEPEAGFAQAAAEPDEPFHFELEGEREEAFATPFLEERNEPAEPAAPALFDNEPATPALHETPASHAAPPAAEHPAEAPSAHAIPNGTAARAEQPIAEPGTAEPPAGETIKTDSAVQTETTAPAEPVRTEAVKTEAVKTEAAKPERAPAPSREQQRPLT